MLTKPPTIAQLHPGARRGVRSLIFRVAVCTLALSLFANAKDRILITLDVPGAIQTFPFSISSAGAITGAYFGADLITHGFLHARNGAVISFDPPGSTSTDPQSITFEEVITGDYSDASGIAHGFVRAVDGTITAFDVPGSFSTFPSSINRRGTITGTYEDVNLTEHGGGDWVGARSTLEEAL